MQIDEIVDNFLSDKLYQWVEQEDLDPQGQLTEAEWLEFLEFAEDDFAESASDHARILFGKWRAARG